MKNAVLIAIAAFVAMAVASGARSQSPREQLNQMVEQLQKSPDDNGLRERIIKFALTLKPAPALPAEAERRMARGAAAFAGAASAVGYQDAVKEFEQAALAAPWHGDAYFNLGVAQDKAGDFDGALRSLKLAQIALPGNKDVTALFYQVEYRKEKANSPAAQAARQKQTDEELVRSLEGARFDCPDLGSGEYRDEHWFVIKANQLTVWTRVIRAPPDLVRANPRDYSPGKVTNARNVPIAGAVARQGGPNWEISYRITPDQVVRESRLDGRAEPTITCRRR